MLKLIWEPRVHLVAVPMVQDEGMFRFLERNGHPLWVCDSLSSAEELTEVACRVARMDFRTPSEGLFPTGSDPPAGCLDHATISVFLEGVSRRLLTELAGDEGVTCTPRLLDSVAAEDLAFVVPPELVTEVALLRDAGGGNGEPGGPPRDRMLHAGSHWLRAVAAARSGCHEIATYLMGRLTGLPDLDLRERMARAIAARSLPDSIEVKALFSAPLAWWLAFCGPEAAPADLERCRLVACAAEVLAPVAPGAFQAGRPALVGPPEDEDDPCP